MPLRYMPPEAIQKGRFGEASDVWAFAVLIWEMLTLGMIPYFDITNDRELIDFVTSGGLPSRDHMTCECPDTLWVLMERCWSKVAKNRPKFSELVVALQTIRDESVGKRTAALVAQATNAKDAAEARAAQERKEKEKLLLEKAALEERLAQHEKFEQDRARELEQLKQKQAQEQEQVMCEAKEAMAEKEREMERLWARIPGNGRLGSGMEFSTIPRRKNAAFAVADERPGLSQPPQHRAQQSLVRRVSNRRCSKEASVRYEIFVV